MSEISVENDRFAPVNERFIIDGNTALLQSDDTSMVILGGYLFSLQSLSSVPSSYRLKKLTSSVKSY